ncbi:MAG: EAL domain-containing protein [Rhizobiales bacterium]|nr:EAL domain-containing protein [Hyphomicrobiales bacterium]
MIWVEQFVRVVEWQGRRMLHNTVIDVDDQERQVVALRAQSKSMRQQARQRSVQLLKFNRELHLHQAVIDQMSERLSVIDRDYRYVISNRANLEFRQLAREDVIGSHVRDILGASYFDECAKPGLDHAFDGVTTRFEEPVIGPDGKECCTQVTLEPFRDSDGEITGAIVSVRDITAVKETEGERRLMASILEQVSDRISIIDRDYRFRLTNKANSDFHQSTKEQMIGRPLADIVGEDYFQTISKPCLDRCFRGETIRFRRPHLDQHGERATLDILLEPYREADGTITGALARLRDVSEAQEMSDRLAYQARYDQLTGLLNRQAFERFLETSIAETARCGRSDALCFIDLDQFKIVNDTVGHLAGDRFLQQVAKLMSSKLHANDILARFGGDEFVLLLHHCSLRRAKRAAEQLIKALADFRFFHEGLMFQVGASIGIAAVNRHADTAGNLMVQADLACYAAKDNGRNQVQVYKKSDAFIRRRQDDMYRAGGIKAALDEDRFFLLGQPIARLCGEGEEVERLEILLRMLGEQRQVIKPNAFIPAAERYGVMAELDCWVIRKTVEQLMDSSGPLASMKVSINLSGVTLNDETSLDVIRRTLTASNLSPERISFEITETAAIRDLARTEAFMGEMRAWGCSFALDDFGSGLSSLKYLKRLPVDFLKIDGSFIRDLPDDAGSRAMVRAISQMACDLRIQTVAEGVENQATRDILKEVGIDFVQGYAIGMPKPLVKGLGTPQSE